MFGVGQTVAVVLHSAVGDWVGYKVLREEDVYTFTDYQGDSHKVVVVREHEVPRVLEDHDVTHEREWDSVVLEQQEADRYMQQWRSPESQDFLIASVTEHPSARVQGHMTDTQTNSVEVEYTYIPGL